MANDEHIDGLLDDFFNNPRADVADATDVTPNDGGHDAIANLKREAMGANEDESHNEHNEYKHEEAHQELSSTVESQSPQKSIFTRWYFIVGAIALFFGAFGVFYVVMTSGATAGGTFISIPDTRSVSTSPISPAPASISIKMPSNENGGSDSVSKPSESGIAGTMPLSVAGFDQKTIADNQAPTLTLSISDPSVAVGKADELKLPASSDPYIEYPVVAEQGKKQVSAQSNSAEEKSLRKERREMRREQAAIERAERRAKEDQESSAKRIASLEKELRQSQQALKKLKAQKMVATKAIAPKKKVAHRKKAQPRANGTKAVVAKIVEKEEMIITEEKEEVVFASPYRISAMTPGQAVLTNGAAVKYVSVGSKIDGALVTKIDSENWLVKTSKGTILP